MHRRRTSAFRAHPLLAVGLLPLAACATAGRADDHDGKSDSELFEDAFTENQNPKGDSATCSGVVVPDRGPFGKKVALTFDDGPNPTTTRKVIQTLREHGAEATFFINGRRVDSADTRALEVEIAGDPNFILANHTWSHPDMRTLSAADRALEIDRTTEVITAAGEPPTFFRFPFGASTCETAEEVRARGYVITGWHVDTADWCFQAGGGVCPEETFKHVPDEFRDDMVAWTMSQVRARQGGIVLFHDIHSNTANTLDAVLDAMEAEGFSFVGLDDVAVFPKLNAGRGEFIGEACDENQDCVFAGGFCLAAEGGVGRCTQSCTTSCPDLAAHPVTRCVMLADPCAPEDGEMPLCSIECGPGDRCPAPLACGDQVSPTGAIRRICW